VTGADLGVYVVQRETDRVWEAACINPHCGEGVHGVAEEPTQRRAEARATKHRVLIRAELAEIEARATRTPVVDWEALAADRERRLSRATRKLFALQAYVRHRQGCGTYWGQACTCGLAEVLVASPVSDASGEPPDATEAGV
jgi:hypothetical protein